MFFRVSFFCAFLFFISCDGGMEIIDRQSDSESIFADYEPVEESSSDVDSSVPSDADSDVVSDEDSEPVSCPGDMAQVGSICVDIYEASRTDATATSQGESTDAAGVLPVLSPGMSTLLQAMI